MVGSASASHQNTAKSAFSPSAVASGSPLSMLVGTFQTVSPRTRVGESRTPILLRTELAPELARPSRFEGGQPAQQRREDGESDEGGHRYRQGDERQAESRHHQPGDAHGAHIAQSERVVPEEVEAPPPHSATAGMRS